VRIALFYFDLTYCAFATPLGGGVFDDLLRSLSGESAYVAGDLTPLFVSRGRVAKPTDTEPPEVTGGLAKPTDTEPPVVTGGLAKPIGNYNEALRECLRQPTAYQRRFHVPSATACQ